MPRKRSDAEAGDEPEAVTLEVEVSRLIASGREAFASEIAFQKARAALAGKLVAKMAGFGALALALLFFMILALVMGSLLALAPVLGAWGALGAVLAGLLLGVALCGLGLVVALRAFKRVMRDKPEDAP
jgi:hypothetical protein